MFLKQKKGNISATFLVLIIIALIMILMVTGYGAKIWSAFFPSTDKSTIKSFDAVFTVLNAKTLSQKDYDSTTMNIYLKDPYRIVLFDDTKLTCDFKYWGARAQKIYHAPKACKAGKMCLCLYKDEPEMDEETNLVKCYDLEKTLTIDRTKLDLDKMICTDSLDGYGSFIFIKRVTYPDKEKHLYILRDNDANRILDSEWSIPVCKTSDSQEFCYNKKNGDNVEAKDENSLKQIYDYCVIQTKARYLSTGIRCVYDTNSNKNDCYVDCKPYDITSSCNTKYKTCEDYNNLNKNIDYTTKIKYTSLEDDYKGYALCTNDVEFCNVNAGKGCQAITWDVYACKDSDSDSGTIIRGNSDCDFPYDPEEKVDLESECKITFLGDLEEKILFNNGFMSFVTSYDNTNEKCKEYMTDHFYEKQSIMTCKQGKTDKCKEYIENSKREESLGVFDDYDCELKLIQHGDEYWLTHYEPTADCEKKINELFTKVYLCKTPVDIVT